MRWIRRSVFFAIVLLGGGCRTGPKKDCPTCQGAGSITCIRCYGSGTIAGETCGICYGRKVLACSCASSSSGVGSAPNVSGGGLSGLGNMKGMGSMSMGGGKCGLLGVEGFPFLCVLLFLRRLRTRSRR